MITSGRHKLKPRRKIETCHDTKGGCHQRSGGIPYFLARVSASLDADHAPTTRRKMKNVLLAGTRILKAAANGDPIRVTDDELKRRDTICNACELWKPEGNLGMGECTHPQCGCTKMKRGLATETCPAGKWNATD